jgi:basic membrane lipoprotein Med (substrate-binding protein (PBP1-ABC) superfamily)
MAANFSRRKFLLYGSATLSTSLLLKACSSNSTTTGGSPGFKIAIALPGVISDQAWNQSGYEGVQLAKQNWVQKHLCRTNSTSQTKPKFSQILRVAAIT